jgi:3-hydroxyisobutyrate dehydrogenase-like beta-hydroxyacid dehydrogenase
VVERVGLIGLGNMGSALATRLVARFEVVGFDVDPARARPAAEVGVAVVQGVEAVADASTVAVLSLPRPAASHEVVESLSDRWRTGGLVIETSTVSPDDARRAAAVCAAAGSGYVDAAILSGVGPVAAGTTTLLVGGAAEVLDRAGPVLAAITDDQRHLGEVGAGMAAKVINNAVAHAVYVVLSEAVALGKANGIALATIVELLSEPGGGLIRPLTHRIGERLAAEDFDGGMPVDAARKDSELALRLAQASRTPLFAIQSAHTVYEIAEAAGLARSDYAVVATLWDRWMAER